MAGRARALQLAAHNGGYAVCGIQEARTSEGAYTTADYHVFSGGSKAPNNAYGCEIWVATTIKDSADRSRHIKFADIGFFIGLLPC